MGQTDVLWGRQYNSLVTFMLWGKATEGSQWCGLSFGGGHSYWKTDRKEL